MEVNFAVQRAETLGPFGPHAVRFLEDLGNKISNINGERCSKSFLIQSIGIAIQRGNASCVMGRTGSMGKLEELNYLLQILPYLLWLNDALATHWKFLISSFCLILQIYIVQKNEITWSITDSINCSKYVGTNLHQRQGNFLQNFSIIINSSRSWCIILPSLTHAIQNHSTYFKYF